jgi:hypothetical protein
LILPLTIQRLTSLTGFFNLTAGIPIGKNPKKDKGEVKAMSTELWIMMLGYG